VLAARAFAMKCSALVRRASGSLLGGGEPARSPCLVIDNLSIPKSHAVLLSSNALAEAIFPALTSEPGTVVSKGRLRSEISCRDVCLLHVPGGR
jgi:hypothetical protein